MQDKPRIAIVGAGLGRVTAGLLLQQAGHDVTLYQQAPSLARIRPRPGLRAPPPLKPKGRGAPAGPPRARPPALGRQPVDLSAPPSGRLAPTLRRRQGVVR